MALPLLSYIFQSYKPNVLGGAGVGEQDQTNLMFCKKKKEEEEKMYTNSIYVKGKNGQS